MMSLEEKAAWITALRSEEFFQGKSFLCDAERRYCCLGVLCEISGFKKAVATWNTRQPTSFIDDRGGSYTHLPSRRMFEQWGINQDAVSHYVEMNDNGASFFEIANAIEADPNI